MWQSLGFTASPYDARPLKPIPEDSELLVGREKEIIDFSTTLESSSEGIQILSGSPGVGKTSFFNVQQYRLSSQTAEFGPRLLQTEELTTIYPEDDPRTISLRVLEGLTKSVEIECSRSKQKVPPEIETVARWAKSRGTSGFDVGIQIAGFGGNFGREVTLPSASEISFEGLRDAIEAVVSGIVEKLGFDGTFVALDNIENLDDSQLGKLLITFRDTLFMIPHVWWVLIGQSGLGSLIQTLDPRVSDRLSGTGLELQPLSFEQLEEAIGLRVKRFSKYPNPNSPLPTEIHRRLYDAAHGEIRFVFRYSHEICTKFVQWVRQQVKGGATANLIASELINNQIPTQLADQLLREIVTQEFDGLSLRPQDRKILRTIAEKGEARPREYAEFGLNSTQDFYSNYISKLHSQHLLSRRQQGKAVYYRLRGIAAMAFELGLLS